MGRRSSVVVVVIIPYVARHLLFHYHSRRGATRRRATRAKRGLRAVVQCLEGEGGVGFDRWRCTFIHNRYVPFDRWRCTCTTRRAPARSAGASRVTSRGGWSGGWGGASSCHALAGWSPAGGANAPGTAPNAGPRGGASRRHSGGRGGGGGGGG